MNSRIALILFIPISKTFYKNYESVENMELSSKSPMKSHSFFLLENIKSIINQNFNNWELLIFSNKTDFIYNLIFKNSNDEFKIYEDRFQFIKTNFNTSYKDILLASCDLCTGEYLCPINFLDILHRERLNTQIKLIKSKKLDIVSSLEFPFDIGESSLVEQDILKYDSSTSNLYFSCIDSNKFILKKDIDFACSSSYIPLDLYTFMIKKSFLNKLKIILSRKQLKNELHITLFLLSYTQIEKAKDSYTYVRSPRIPYEENKHIDNRLLTNNTIALFNKYKTIENRTFLREILSKFNFYQDLEDVKFNLCDATDSIKLNILIPLEELGIGGTETYILSLCKLLKNHNINIYILTNGGILEDTFILNNINILKFHNISSNKINSEKEFNKDYLRQNKEYDSTAYKVNILKDIIEKYKIDMLFCHSPNEIELCYEVKKVYSIPILATIHGTFYRKDIMLKAASYFDAIIFVSKMTFLKYEDTIKEFKKNKFHVIPNAINIKDSLYLNKPKFLENNKDLDYLNTLLEKIDKSNESYPDNNTPKILTYCSRLSLGKSKLALLFLNSFEELLETHQNLYALILGDGNEKLKVIDYSNKINSKYGKKVFVLGSVENVYYFYEKSFAVIGTGRVALESLSIGTPVFALGLSGFKGLVSKNNINEMINSNFGDHIDTFHNLYSFNSNHNQLKDSLNKFLFTDKYSFICKWCKTYIKNNLNLNLTVSKISNIIFNTVKHT